MTPSAYPSFLLCAVESRPVCKALWTPNTYRILWTIRRYLFPQLRPMSLIIRCAKCMVKICRNAVMNQNRIEVDLQTRKYDVHGRMKPSWIRIKTAHSHLHKQLTARNQNFLASRQMKASWECEYACVHGSGFERACILMSNFSLGLLHERKFVPLNIDLFTFVHHFQVRLTICSAFCIVILSVFKFRGRAL